MSNEEYGYSEYWKSVKSYAQEIVELSRDEDQEISDLLYETVDQSAWVFMYYGAKQTIEHSKNSDAYEDVGIELDTSQGFNGIRSQVAFWALYTDIQEAITKIEEEEE